jgi:Rrf2 family protein
MRVSARADYALRAVAELAAAGGVLLNREELSTRQGIPFQFLESVLLALKHAGVVQSQRGARGGFRLARPANTISLADVIRAVDGPMADVRGDRPEAVAYEGAAEHLREVWIAVRASLRAILEQITVEDLVRGRMPRAVRRLTQDPESWTSIGRVRGAGRSPTALPRRAAPDA